jgi:hypothetical protein
VSNDNVAGGQGTQNVTQANTASATTNAMDTYTAQQSATQVQDGSGPGTRTASTTQTVVVDQSATGSASASQLDQTNGNVSQTNEAPAVANATTAGSADQTLTQTQVGPGPAEWTVTNRQTTVDSQRSNVSSGVFQGPSSGDTAAEAANSTPSPVVGPSGPAAPPAVAWSGPAVPGGPSVRGPPGSPGATQPFVSVTGPALATSSTPIPETGSVARSLLLSVPLPDAGRLVQVASGPAWSTPPTSAVAGTVPSAAGTGSSATPPGSPTSGSGGLQLLGGSGSAPLLLVLLLALLGGLLMIAAPRGARVLVLASLAPARVAVAPLERPG